MVSSNLKLSFLEIDNVTARGIALGTTKSA